MRGPGYRLDLDVRRTWRCQACGRERRLMGDVTTVRCGCGPDAWMTIVSERTVPPRPVSSVTGREQTVESFQLTEEELAKPIEGRIRRRPAPPPPPEPTNDRRGNRPPPRRPQRQPLGDAPVPEALVEENTAPPHERPRRPRREPPLQPPADEAPPPPTPPANDSFGDGL